MLPISVRALATAAKRTPFKIAFFGRGEFSCNTLRALYEARDVWDHITVVTNPDEWIGTHRRDLSVSPLKLLGKSLDLDVSLLPDKMRGFDTWVPPEPFTNPDPSHLIISASFGHAIPSGVLDLFQPSHRLNVHPSLLPKYRGAAPIQRAIASGATETGVSILQMRHISQGFDTGPVWDSSLVRIPERTSYVNLESILAQEGGRLLVSVLRDMMANKATLTPQDDSLATKAKLIIPETAHIKWKKWDATKLDRLHRAINHQRPLYTYLLPSGRKIRLLDIAPRFADQEVSDGNVYNHAVLEQPGDARWDFNVRAIVVRCADDSEIYVHRLQSEGRKALVALDWWNGIRPAWINKGVLRLGDLEEATAPARL